MSLLDDFNVCNSTRGNWITSSLGVQYQQIGDILYYQCSKDLRDWFYNLQFPVSLYKNSKRPYLVHKGFKEMWHSIRDDIAKLTFTSVRGYSQGGIFAQCTHEDTFINKGIILDTVTFGSPTYIWMPSTLIKNRFTSVRNIRNKEDKIASAYTLLGYKRVGQDIVLTGDNPRGNMSYLEHISGHAPEIYRRRLEEYDALSN